MIDARLNLATGTAEREAAVVMVPARPGNQRITLAANEAEYVLAFVVDLRQCRASRIIPSAGRWRAVQAACGNR